MKKHVQGSKKVLSACPGQVHFPVGLATFHSHLQMGKGPGNASHLPTKL